ncbi:AAA family ATPase [Actinopolyspora mortivallis]|uniref:ATPase n=1 Tax=Actinopolyspora mortivallis TaxID=33906 RepID=A0A2T0GZ69_ACTMO|nr:MoxR family ATPase [Actinopolyspora mortivallis]PRW64412.1 ATPase [Actinopolyspora mortivallis]
MTPETSSSGNVTSTPPEDDTAHARTGGTVPPTGTSSIEHAHDTLNRVISNVESVLSGKREVIRLALTTLLAEGHLLVEDVPGVGKTSLAKALARSVDCTTNRIQFTPDLLPSDITGVSVYDRHSGSFEFRGGPVFANIVVGDEINRASPKTQSALLECMEENQVTIDGHRHPLDTPFMVIATQNPVELEGTYALPEAQRDRFTCRISLGYPDREAEFAMLDGHAGHDPVAELSPVTTTNEVTQLLRTVRGIHVSPELRRYVIELVSATRELSELRLGASPRATLQLMRTARAQAVLSGREFVIPDDVHRVAVPVLAHRLVLSGEARAARQSAADLVRQLLGRVPVPRARDGQR